jgi:uracil-DNA glycosylase family 4
MSAEPGAPDDLTTLCHDIVTCRACPRLVAWRELVAVEKRASYANDTYWGRPVPGFGDPDARIAVLGLAPAAHGGNRTGRVFTGDRSGDFLFASMHRCGLANQATSDSRDDGLRLHNAYVLAAVRCAPPANKPTVEERDTCAPFMQREFALLRNLRVVVALGQFGYDAACRHYGIRPRPAFGHGVEAAATADGVTVVCSFHPSQQNTFTGKLTDSMLDDVFAKAIVLAS